MAVVRNPFKPTAGATPPLLVGRQPVLDGTNRPTRQITGISLPDGGGLTFSERPTAVMQWREQLGKLLDVLEDHGTGLLITIDEVHAAGREELRDLAAHFQHLIRDDRDVALAMAGLPSAVSELLNDDVLTFLRRANRVELHDVDLDDVREALRITIESQGRRITDSALSKATQATGGYPFMIQLVGYHVWRKSDGGVVDDDAVAAGVPVARRRLGSLVHATALADLSDVDRTYLVAMAQDDGESSTAAVASRLRVTATYAGVYRARLIDAGMIEPTRRGYVDFALPFLREYLREHAARYEMSGRVSGSGR
jgi:hypothetical protein